ncbi:MAG: transposase [Pseudomonadota bacterium]|nr:transposase [Pseudomonadota bacterium]
MITLAQLLREHRDEVVQTYGNRMRAEHHTAMQAVLACHSPACGELRYDCHGCDQVQSAYPSCGHRSCPACQHGTNNQWLDRQRQKLLPVDYYLVTFTLPAQLRSLVWHHQRRLYHSLFSVAQATLNQFAGNDRRIGNRLGLVGVLHTHSRRLAFHPHVHFVVPGGGLNRHQWQARAGRYLFNGKALAKVFRARFLAALREQGFTLPDHLPREWVAQCEHVGRGEQALTYLARYLYRGVLREQNILDYDGERVSFQYQDSDTGQWRTLNEPAVRFLWRVLQHVLPRGFRRARDYGFLHGNARRTLQRLQLLLRAPVPENLCVKKRPPRLCPGCGQAMTVTLRRRSCRGAVARRR